MTDNSQIMTFEESVRKRPAMYIGSIRLERLFEGIINQCIEICKTDEIRFSISILGDNNFSLKLFSEIDLSPFFRLFEIGQTEEIYLPKILKIIAAKFEISQKKEGNKTESIINFEIDKTVIPDTSIDYQKLSETVLQIAILNRRVEILIKDTRQKFINQNYYHFPQGIFYLFDRAKIEVLHKSSFQLIFDDSISGNKYQIVLAYRTDWYPEPLIISFANEINTICGGSLVDGILEGLFLACKVFVKENSLSTYKIKRKKFFNGLVLMCSVRGNKFVYGGSFKETLEDNEVKEEAKKITKELAYTYFNQNKENAYSFLFRFDETQLTSGIF